MRALAAIFFLIQAQSEQHYWMRVPVGAIIVPLLETISLFLIRGHFKDWNVSTYMIQHTHTHKKWLRVPRTRKHVLAHTREHVSDRVKWRHGGGFTEFISHMCQYTGVCSHGNELEPRKNLEIHGKRDGKDRKVEQMTWGAKHSAWNNELSKPTDGDTFSSSSSKLAACSWKNVLF